MKLNPFKDLPPDCVANNNIIGIKPKKEIFNQFSISNDQLKERIYFNWLIT